VKLQEFRIEKGYSQEEISKILGISKSYYCKIESNVRNPSYEFIKKFKASFKNADVDELFFATK
jgi:transcriptional regulator with XRE-family HTH domain